MRWSHGVLPCLVFLASACGAAPDDFTSQTSCSGKCDHRESDNPQPTYAQVVQKVMDNYHLDAIKTSFPEAEVKAQDDLPNNEVSFKLALRAAMESFLYDGRDVESPLFTASDPDMELTSCADVTFADRVLCFMNQQVSLLALITAEGRQEVVIDGQTHNLYSPENQETIAKNWVFYLKLPELSEHLHWAVVRRARVDGMTIVHNYGFN